MLPATLGTSLLRNVLEFKGANRAGNGIIRPGDGMFRARQDL